MCYNSRFISPDLRSEIYANLCKKVLKRPAVARSRLAGVTGWRGFLMEGGPTIIMHSDPEK